MRDFLEEVAPVLTRTANLLELAMKAEGKWPKELVTKLERMQSGLELTALGAMEAMDMVAADAQASARSSAAARPPSPPNPPTTNRGVNPPKRTRTPPRQKALKLKPMRPRRRVRAR